MKKALFILDRSAFDLIYGAELQNAIARRADFVAPPQTSDTIHARPDLLREVEAIFSGWGAPRLDEDFLAAAPKLRAFFYGAGSIKGFTTPTFWTRDIAITTAAVANAVPVAEYTLATILFSLKHGWHHALGAKRLGHFPGATKAPGAYRAKIGLISLGTIGRLVRERLRPFDLEILVYDPYLNAGDAAALGIRRVPLDEIFKSCDVVSLHTPLLPETAGMIGGRHFAQMKPGATFINTARGALVRERELIESFTARPDLTAVLDVTSPEPPAPGSPLYTLPNIVLTPHLAGSQHAECRRMGRLMLDEFDRWLRGEPLRWAVTPERIARVA